MHSWCRPYFCAGPVNPFGPAPFNFVPPPPLGPYPTVHRATMHSDMPFCDGRYPSRSVSWQVSCCCICASCLCSLGPVSCTPCASAAFSQAVHGIKDIKLMRAWLRVLSGLSLVVYTLTPTMNLRFNLQASHTSPPTAAAASSSALSAAGLVGEHLTDATAI